MRAVTTNHMRNEIQNTGTPAQLKSILHKINFSFICTQGPHVSGSDTLQALDWLIFIHISLNALYFNILISLYVSFFNGINKC